MVITAGCSSAIVGADLLLARAWVPVGATETPGEVPVDVTIVFGTQTVVIHTTGLIEGTAPDPGDGGPIQIG